MFLGALSQRGHQARAGRGRVVAVRRRACAPRGSRPGPAPTARPPARLRRRDRGSIRSETDSRRMASVASAGPSPSWRSRRSRLRSSSRAVTRCCRERWSSRLANTVCTSAPTWTPTSSSRRRSPGPNGSRCGATSSRSRPRSVPPTTRSTVTGLPLLSPMATCSGLGAGRRANVDRRIGEPESSRQQRQGLGQCGLRSRGGLESTEVRDDPVRELPVSVDGATEPALQCHGERQHEQGEDAAGEDGPEPDVGGLADRRGDGNERGRDETGRERLDHRPAYGRFHLVEPIAVHGHHQAAEDCRCDQEDQYVPGQQRFAGQPLWQVAEQHPGHHATQDPDERQAGGQRRGPVVAARVAPAEQGDHRRHGYHQGRRYDGHLGLQPGRLRGQSAGRAEQPDGVPRQREGGDRQQYRRHGVGG